MNTEIVQKITTTLQELYPSGAGLHEPYFAGNEWQYVKECLDTRWVSYVGKYVDEFEKRLATFTGAKRAVATATGTAALHISLELLGIGDGDEVLTPALTFVATTNAICYTGAIPHFVDSEERTLGIDPVKLEKHLRKIGEIKDGCLYNRETGRKICAIIPVHIFGHPVDMDALLEIARRYHLQVVEDAAESLGSYYKGKHTGNHGIIASLSFNGNKVVTTGGGGAILTNDDRLADRAKHITTTAKIKHPWKFIHDEIGYNYRLTNISAAIGCAQLEQLPEFLKKKRVLAEKYQRVFSNIPGVRTFNEPEFAQSNYWLNALILDPSQTHVRDQILELTNSKGIGTRPAWTLMHLLEPFKNAPRADLSIAEDLEKRLICIPSSVFL